MDNCESFANDTIFIRGEYTVGILVTELEKRQMKRMSNKESHQLTKECLQNALINIMAVKPFDKITITELVLRSGVSRTAFYRHYKSKEDVLNELSNDLIHEMAVTIAEYRNKFNSKDFSYKNLQNEYSRRSETN